MKVKMSLKNTVVIRPTLFSNESEDCPTVKYEVNMSTVKMKVAATQILDGKVRTTMKVKNILKEGIWKVRVTMKVMAKTRRRVREGNS